MHSDPHIHTGITTLRFKPAYNPYTEPSMEVFSYHSGESDANDTCTSLEFNRVSLLWHVQDWRNGWRWEILVSSGPRCLYPWGFLRMSASSLGVYPWNGKGTFIVIFSSDARVLCRPTMIKYGIDNIRDLVGHKVNLQMVCNNPLCRLEKWREDETHCGLRCIKGIYLISVTSIQIGIGISCSLLYERNYIAVKTFWMTKRGPRAWCM